MVFLLLGLALGFCSGCFRHLLFDSFDPPSGEVLLESSFDNGSSAEWIPFPDERYWTVKDGRYGLASHAPNGVPQRTFSRETDWNRLTWHNYTITARVLFVTSRGDDWRGPDDNLTSILFRVIDDSNYMELRFSPLSACYNIHWQPLGPPSAEVSLFSHKDDESTLLGWGFVGYHGESEFEVRIEARGGLCAVFVDDCHVLSASDVHPHVGGIGLQTSVQHRPSELLEEEYWSEAWFSDVHVEAL